MITKCLPGILIFMQKGDIPDGMFNDWNRVSTEQ